MIIDEKYEAICADALEMALKKGASKARACLTLGTEDMIGILDGKIDKISGYRDRGLDLTLYAGSRHGDFSINRLDRDSVEKAIDKALEVIRHTAEDPCRDLPDPSRICRSAVTGDELALTDSRYPSITQDDRIARALSANAGEFCDGYRILSQESEYSDSKTEVLLMDTSGTRCRENETSFDFFTEITLEADGKRYSGQFWDSSPFSDRLEPKTCLERALKMAVARIGSGPVSSRRCNLVLDREVSYKVVSPILGALRGLSQQQRRSFLQDSLGKRLFPEGMTLLDDPLRKGETGSHLFDFEGVGIDTAPIIKDGVIQMYFISTYMSALMGVSPTRAAATRPLLCPWPRKGLDRDAILGMCGEGICVTDLNGGNCNETTGDFSYGIEGFTFRDGKPDRPVSEMLMSGNILKLWEGFIAAGEDYRTCMSKLIPTLAFSNVDFSG